MYPCLLKKASIWHFHQHKSFSFDRIFLKLAYKVDIDEISYKFENWPDQLHPLDWWKNSVRLCHHYNLFRLNRNILKFAAKMDMDKISEKFGNWPDRFIYYRITSHWLLEKPLFDFVVCRFIYYRITSHWLLEKPLFDFVVCITLSVLIRSSDRISDGHKTGQIGSFIRVTSTWFAERKNLLSDFVISITFTFP